MWGTLFAIIAVMATLQLGGPIKEYVSHHKRGQEPLCDAFVSTRSTKS